MNWQSIIQIILFLLILFLVSKPLGSYLSYILNGKSKFLQKLESSIFRLLRIDNQREMLWQNYASAFIIFNFCGLLFLYLILRLQSYLPFNSQGFSNLSPDLAFNAAVSFVSNTNWQSYGGESTLSYFSQMFGLGVQNFLSSAGGICILLVLIRGFISNCNTKLGNFWADLFRVTVGILLPLSFILSICLVSQGVVQNFSDYKQVNLIDPASVDDQNIETQILPLGPVASQVAIKQLGTNGGGYYNVNSAHPYENPTPLSNLFEVLAILLIPAALCFTFGQMISDTRQGLAMFIVMGIVFILFLLPTFYFEQSGSPLKLMSQDSPAAQAGNMEGKELRFGVVNSAIWASATTAASNGSVNSMHDSFTPLGGLFPMLLMQLGEVIFGGVGSGLYGLIAFAILAIFVAGLMVGRTPEYLGKKIETFEMKMAMLMVLLPPLLVLIGTALSVSIESGHATISNPGPHALSQLLYAYSSMANNNGSAFAGLGANIPFHNILGGVLMYLSRFFLVIPALALAGSLGRKKIVPASSGTLATHTPLFICFLIIVILAVGALSFLPALALGPIAEHLELLK